MATVKPQTKSSNEVQESHSSQPKTLHRIIRKLAGWAVWSFFTEVRVIGAENVPKDGPIIV